MTTRDGYLEDQLARGRSTFSKEDARRQLAVSSDALTAAATRLIKKRRLISPWRGFYLILRPEDRVTGAPDPVRWIDAFMKFQKLDYRISLLRAAAFHGSSHQAAMVFQVVIPKQLRSFELGRHRIQFIYQQKEAFKDINQKDNLAQIKSETGFARVAGIEATLLDCARYFHKSGGINSVAQIVHDLGGKASGRKLAGVATSYENSSVRRLGYLLDQFGHERQAKWLLPFAREAKSLKALDPSVKPVIEELQYERNSKWMLEINESVEIDT